VALRGPGRPVSLLALVQHAPRAAVATSVGKVKIHVVRVPVKMTVALAGPVRTETVLVAHVPREIHGHEPASGAITNAVNLEAQAAVTIQAHPVERCRQPTVSP